MTLGEIVTEACKRPGLVEALQYAANVEADRAIHQALEWQRTGVSTAGEGHWETCFGVIFAAVVDQHQDRIVPRDRVLLPLTKHEAEAMILIGEKCLASGFATAAPSLSVTNGQRTEGE